MFFWLSEPAGRSDPGAGGPQEKPASSAEGQAGSPASAAPPTNGGSEASATTLGPSETPSVVSDAELEPEELAEARHYGRIQRKCLLADRGLDLLYWAVAALVLARPLEGLLAGGIGWKALDRLLAHSDTLRLVGLVGGLMLLHALVSAPLTFYAGYVVEHRFGLSRLSVLRWAWRYVKHLLLALLLTLLLGVGLFWIIRWTGPWWWLAGAGAFFLFSVVLGQLAPVLILPLFYRVEKLDRPELLDRLRRLAEGTGLSLEGIYRLDLSVETVKANAALVGLGRTRRVLLGDTLLEQFSPEEIETIFAHEVGHHVHWHIGKMFLVGLIGSAVGFFICDRLLVWWVGFGTVAEQAEAALSGMTGGLANGLAQTAPFSYQQFPVWAMPMVVWLLAVLGMLSEPLLNALSRWHERQADWYALQRTGNPEAFCRAFRRLSRLNKQDPAPPGWDVVLFHSHPPVRDRLALAEQFIPQSTPASPAHHDGPGKPG